ncbi:unnamed protein product [Cylicostephanus goldi]|uniref:Uncharacterized protein n=1 Tax=Cylicostephanus goldi TaxID=71465 RepID=A0A3P6SWA9_CYLGO|nr:unnamed protein product [Cylicostephanus goldi]
MAGYIIRIKAPLHGYATWANGRLITLFSAPAYRGSSEDTANLGACIDAPDSGRLVIKQLKVSETVRKKREDDAYTRQIALNDITDYGLHGVSLSQPPIYH